MDRTSFSSHTSMPGYCPPFLNIRRSPAIFYPRLIDLRMPFVLHCTADFYHQRIHTKRSKKINELLEKLQMFASRQIYFTPRISTTGASYRDSMVNITFFRQAQQRQRSMKAGRARNVSKLNRIFDHDGKRSLFHQCPSVITTDSDNE